LKKIQSYALAQQDKNRLDELNNEVALWEGRVNTMRGDWHYIVTKDNSVNAFVTDLCPRRIFINQGLFDIINPTDDELALILGHEVSHLILGHSESSSSVEFFMGIHFFLLNYYSNINEN
jgi:Zn-dependent protease with chaperone function